MALEGTIDEETLTMSNSIFSFIFLFEMIFKMTAYGIKAYIRVNFNKLDLIANISSLLDFVYS